MIHEEKQILRTQMRQALSVFDGRAAASEKIQRLLREAKTWREAKVIYGFSPLPVEPDWLGCDWPPDKTLAFPRICGHEMAFFTASSPAQLLTGTHGILEPQGHTPAPPPDLILVPGLAFDPTGARLGRNRGYYDRFLAQTLAKTLGLAFAFQIVPHVPMEPHDIHLGNILTETGLAAPAV